MSFDDLLYEKIEPFNTGMLKVSDLHELYYEESGNPEGLPVLVVHGGPGDSSSPKHRRRFNPEKFRIILFDQRGAGLSSPKACLEANNTQCLISDIEKLRNHLNVDKWMIQATSWGSTLSLVYAQKYPQNVLGMVLNGIFLAYSVNTDWIHGPSGAARVFPEFYDAYIEWLPEKERNDPFNAYSKRIHGNDKPLAIEAAKRMLTYEGQIMSMEETSIQKEKERKDLEISMTDTEKKEADAWFDDFAFTHCLIETHYGQQNYFLEDDQILNHVDSLKDIPITLLHGRYDLICPLKNAYKLKKYIPHSKLVVVPNAGHGTGEMLTEVMHEIDVMYECIKN